MNIESITFDTNNNKIIVKLLEGGVLEYISAESYLISFPDRQEDCLAMGWDII